MTVSSTSAPGRAEGVARLLPLFLVSLVSVGYEIALTRWFSIVSWSEYGYWVISITMVGIAASGVALNLTKDWMVARADAVLAALPFLLVLSLAGGYVATTLIEFNPLALQNRATAGAQLLNIAAYYAALFPFFFLGGLFIGLYFVAYESQIPRIYAADLIGAGIAGVLAIGLMTLVHPFELPRVLLAVLALAGWPLLRRTGTRALLVALTLAAIAVLPRLAQPGYNEYKAISAPLRVPDSKVVERIVSPRGVFEVLDNFTERLDIDLSNNDTMLAGAEPVATYGLYGDGNRLTSLARQAPGELRYLNALLDALPYRVGADKPRVLLVGTRGGFRLDEARQLGAGRIVALEPDPTVRGLIERYRSDLPPDARPLADPPSAYLRRGERFDLIDIASDFQDTSNISKYSFTAEGLADYLGALDEGGMLSVPVSIREFTVYAVRLVNTAREALRRAGVADPAAHVVVYRSAWNARIVLSRQPFTAQRLDALRRLCDERSFDVSYLAGRDLAGARIWNDLPPVSFEEVRPSAAGEQQDALAAEIRAYVLPGGQPWPRTVDLSPATFDRPHPNAVLRLGALERLLERIDLIPREEISAMVSLAVLAQSVVIALLVLSLPLFRRRTMGTHRRIAGRSILYFAGLGLGFLFIEIYLIEKATYFLNDRTLGFSLTLAGLLCFSGAGSYLSGRFQDSDAQVRRGLARACAVILAFCALAWIAGGPALTAAVVWPLWLKAACLLLAMAPVGIALGFPFALGMAALRPHPQFLPWAWSLNGAFSVVASPLAYLLVLGQGNRILLLLSMLLYLVVWLSLPLQGARQPAVRA